MFSKKKAIKTVITLSTAFALCAPIAAPKTVYAFSFDADDVSTAIMLWQMLFPPKYPQPTEQKHPSQGSNVPKKKTFCDNNPNRDIHCGNTIKPIEHWYRHQHKPVTVEPEEAKTATPISDKTRIRSNVIATIMVNGRKYADVTIDEYDNGKYKDSKNVLLDVYGSNTTNPITYEGVVRDRYGEGDKSWEESLKSAETYIEQNLGHPYNIYDPMNFIDEYSKSTYTPTDLQSAVTSAYKGVEQVAPQVIEELKHQFDNNERGKRSVFEYGSKIEAPKYANAQNIARKIASEKYEIRGERVHKELAPIFKQYLGKLPEEIYFENLENFTWDDFTTSEDGRKGWIPNGKTELDLHWLISKPWYIDAYTMSPKDVTAYHMVNRETFLQGHSLMRFMPVMGIPADETHRYNILQMFDVTSSEEFSKTNLPPDFMNIPNNKTENGNYSSPAEGNKLTTTDVMGGLTGFGHSEVELNNPQFLLPYLDYEAINAGMEGWHTKMSWLYPYFYEWEYEGAQPNQIILKEVFDPQNYAGHEDTDQKQGYTPPNYPYYTGRVIYLTRANETAN